MQNNQQEILKVDKKANSPIYLNQIPEDILNNKLLKEAIDILPKNYNFEIYKSIWRIIQIQAQQQKKKVNIALQFPEGLMMFACMISDILTSFTTCQCIIMGDVAYGACCIDDITSKQLNADLIIHYGHSCLIPITETLTKCLYVFVEIDIDLKHFIDTVKANFQNKNQIIYLMGTVQFNSVLFNAKQKLTEEGYSNIIIPQEKPRSSGEVLGCTSPVLSVDDKNENIMLFISDGRFHIEAAMMQNPKFTTYQYNPYSKEITIEKLDNELILQIRQKEIQKCKNMKQNMIGVIFGTLGRQGNTYLLKRIEDSLKSHNLNYFVLLVSEINFQQLQQIAHRVDFFLQIACPRLSIDWGNQCPKPLLNPYEYFVWLNEVQWKAVYPMNNYSNNSEIWTNYYHKKQQDKDQKDSKQKAKIVLLSQQ